MRLNTGRYWRDETGATAIEYGLIAGLVSIVILSSIQGMSASLLGIFTTINSGFTGH